MKERKGEREEKKTCTKPNCSAITAREKRHALNGCFCTKPQADNISGLVRGKGLRLGVYIAEIRENYAVILTTVGGQF